MKPTILTGLRTNADYHLGNYLGAMQPIIRMANAHSNEHKVHMFIPDLHSFTSPVDFSTFYEQTFKNLKVFFAAGLPLDNPNVHVYRQGHVSAHSELTVILNNFTSFGQLSRMVEFKEKKSRLEDEFVSVGLFDYPVLMVADILLYDAELVPVGDDQRQHLELARDTAERFNNRFGETFVLPKTIKEQAAFFGVEEPLRVMSLQNPDKKMSKSVTDPAGTITLFDSPQEARKKVMSAVTDSLGQINFDRVNQPGITNLLTMLAVLRGQSQAEVNQEFVGQAQYGGLKQAVADEVEKVLVDLQARFNALDDTEVLSKLERDEVYANEYSQAILAKVQRAIGLRQ
ncbi:tryptophan--tRNA ligase [Candidatus Saccharibacteria bacterium]|nr:tryptophan--tRNA ligase [Candidatus Saccharibacteria bacterium]MCB9821668.1 tryptophan--tRNA ligase [Candidatus Nomurabacteria bacterium]